jgi:CO/xanthine dehydrogenase FAD-binding subunit
MITSYHRPTTLDEALRLLSRPTPVTVPLGGGTVLSHQRGESIEVVDLQALALNEITLRGNLVEVGATTTLQQLLEWTACPPGLATAIRLEAPLNLRNSSTVAGTLVTADGGSSFATVLLALDAQVKLKLAVADSMALGQYLPLRTQVERGYLITSVTWPLAAALQFDYVARTPGDRPIVAVAVARWPSGRTRTAAGGWGSTPLLAMDGPDSGGVEAAVANALHDADDAWGSADYRMHAAAVLARRCLARWQ